MTIGATIGISTVVLSSLYAAIATGDEAGALGGSVDPGGFLEKAAVAAKARRSQDAVRWATKAIDAKNADPIAFYLRGREQLRLGAFHESVRDFDQYVSRRPDRATRMWERGIACYYAEQFQAGADQFRAYQTYHGNDVENAVWHVLCLAHVIGFEAAQAEIMPIKSDSRIPMMAIYDLFRGRLEPEDVMQVARAGRPRVVARREFVRSRSCHPVECRNDS